MNVTGLGNKTVQHQSYPALAYQIFVISRGKDIIDGTGQHLPVVFRLSEETKDLLDHITQLYLGQLAFMNFTLDATKNEIRSQLAKVTSSLIQTSLNNGRLDENKILLSLYMLVLPEVGLFGKTNNQFVGEYLLDIYDKEFNTNQEKKTSLYGDLLYLLCWVLRRETEYKKALDLTNEGIKIFPEDARFYHSRFLLTVCETPKKAPSHVLMKFYDKYLEDIQKAMDLYPLLLKDQPLLIINNVNAVLLNSKLYTELLKLQIDENLSQEKKKEQLELLKTSLLSRIKETVGFNYINYPEFQHTEALLIYVQAMATDKLNEKLRVVDLAISKINESLQIAKKLAGYHTASYEGLQTEMHRMKQHVLDGISA